VDPRAKKPVITAISHLSSGRPIGGVGFFFSEVPVFLRGSGLHPFGTALEILTFRVTYELRRQEVLPFLSGGRETLMSAVLGVRVRRPG
jgi:hypothetical protein